MNDGSYFAVIPVTVLYDERLKPIERLLYGTIVLLTSKEGFCFASNGYLAKLYKCSDVSISRHINQLQKCGYISVEIKDNYQRKIYVDMVNKIDKGDYQNLQGGTSEMIRGFINSDKGVYQNRQDINISHIDNLKVKNKGKEISKEKHRYGEYKNVLLSDDELAKLKAEFPVDWEERIERVSEYCASKGKTYKNYLATIRTWARNEQKKTDQPARIRRNDAQAGYERAKQLLGITEEDE